MQRCFRLAFLSLALSIPGCGSAPYKEPATKSIDVSSLIPTLEQQLSQLSKEAANLGQYQSELDEATRQLDDAQARLDRLTRQESSIADDWATAQMRVTQAYSGLTEYKAAKLDLDLDAIERVNDWKNEYRESKHREIRETRELRNGIKNRLGISYSSDIYEREDERERSKANVEAERLANQKLIDERNSIAAREDVLLQTFNRATHHRDQLESTAKVLPEEIDECRQRIATFKQAIIQHKGDVAAAQSEVDRLTRLTEELQSIVRDQQKLEKEKLELDKLRVENSVHMPVETQATVHPVTVSQQSPAQLTSVGSMAVSTLPSMPTSRPQLMGYPYAPAAAKSSGRTSKLIPWRYDPDNNPPAKLQWVDGYERKNGTWVDGHMRTKSDKSFQNNLSTKGNYNPSTGTVGSQFPPMDAVGYSGPTTYVRPYVKS